MARKHRRSRTRLSLGPIHRIKTLTADRGAQQPRNVDMMIRDIFRTRRWRSRRSRCRRTARRKAMMAETEACTPMEEAGSGVLAWVWAEAEGGVGETGVAGVVAMGVVAAVLTVVTVAPLSDIPWGMEESGGGDVGVGVGEGMREGWLRFWFWLEDTTSVGRLKFFFLCLLQRILQVESFARVLLIMWEPMRMLRACRILE